MASAADVFEQRERDKEEARRRLLPELECECHRGPDFEGPDEYCPLHGRAAAFYLERIGQLEQDRSRDEAFQAGREAAARDIEATGNYERQARIAREGLRPGEATR